MNQLKNPAAYVLGKRVLLALYRKLETPQKELLQVINHYNYYILNFKLVVSIMHFHWEKKF
jgi:hypothetical protein